MIGQPSGAEDDGIEPQCDEHSARFPGELLTIRGVLQVDRAEARSEGWLEQRG